MVTSLLGVWLMGCASQSLELELRVDGPARVRVDQLGPVDVPAVILADGTTTDVEWSVDAPGVVSVESGRVVAVGPGEAAPNLRVGHPGELGE